MPSFFIRPAGEDDFPELSGIYQRAVRISCAEWYTPDQIEAWQDAASEAGPWTESFRETNCFVACNRSGRLLAFGDLHPGTGQISRLYVDPDAQGTGIGTALLTEMENRLLHLGFREASLESALNALHFYENRGYSCLGSVSLPFNGVLFTQYRMLKRW